MAEKMTREEGTKKIGELVNEAHAALHAAETIADDLGISFDFDPAYGMGGTYFPDRTRRSEWDDVPFWAESNSWNYEDGDDGYWRSSSSTC